MLEAASEMFQSSGFMPHGHCFLWTPTLLWSYVLSDGAIAISYFSIPVALWYFAEKRQDLPFRWIFVMFGIFVMACGTTHVFAIVNIWAPEYWLDAGIKVITAVVSVVTGVMLWPLIPQALAIPSPEKLRRVNQELQDEILRRRNTEAELREINKMLEARTAQLETSNRELESFSYSVSHDLRAPLRHIDSYSKLLAKEATNLSDNGIQYLDAITRSSAVMGKLIDGLLMLSRTVRLDMNEQSVDLNDVVADARRESQPVSSGNTIDWQVGNLPVVRGDTALLRQVFTNLLSNSVKFSNGRLQPVIRIESKDGEDGEVIVVIADNGAGFDPRFKGKLFGAFQRLHRQDEFEGTGIGLATVRRIIERHGGRVWADGKLDAGASFFVALHRA